MEDLKKTLEKILEDCRKEIEEYGDLIPKVFCKREGEIFAIEVPGDNNIRRPIKVIIEALRKMKVEWIAVIVTGHGVEQKKIPENYKGKIRDLPWSKEFLVGYIVSRDGRRYGAMQEIIRYEDGLEFEELMELDDFSGFLVPEPW